MLPVYDLLCFRIINFTGSNVAIQYIICKTEIVLICLAAQTVDRNFLDKRFRKPEIAPYSLDFLNGKLRKRTEIAGRVAVSCRISYPVLRKIACVYNSSVHGLRDRIYNSHSYSRGKVDRALLRQIKRNSIFQTVNRISYIYRVVSDPEMITQKMCHVDISLISVRHKDSYNPVTSKRLDTKRRRYRRILASGDTENGVAPLPVFLEKITYPLYTFIFCLRCIKHTVTPLFEVFLSRLQG